MHHERRRHIKKRMLEFDKLPDQFNITLYVYYWPNKEINEIIQSSCIKGDSYDDNFYIGAVSWFNGGYIGMVDLIFTILNLISEIKHADKTKKKRRKR